VANDTTITVRQTAAAMPFSGSISDAAPGDRFFVISISPSGEGDRYVQGEVGAAGFDGTISLNEDGRYYYDGPEPVQVVRATGLTATRIAAREAPPGARTPFSVAEWQSLVPAAEVIGGISVLRLPPEATPTSTPTAGRTP
jgi:hypothetical protein